MNFIILFVIWFVAGILSLNFHNDQFNIINFCSALLFFILTIILFLKVIGIILNLIANFLSTKKKYREVNSEEKEEYFRDKTTEHITLNHPDYIGLLTKIDKKKIAEEYLESLKKEKKHGKNK